jgi:hypothetical protein
MTFEDWWDTTKPWATPETFGSCRQAWLRSQIAERERCAAICDRKHDIRSRDGFPREASAARSLAKEIRGQTQL